MRAASSASRHREAFTAALREAYLRAPGEVLPNALWKTLARLDGCQLHYERKPAGPPSHLEIWQEQRLLLYWDAAREWKGIDPPLAAAIPFALAHEYYRPHLGRSFSRSRAYFRLVWRGGSADPRLPAGFRFSEAQAEYEAEQAAELIARCYPDIHPSAETVLGWTKHPVFDPRLWVWAWDEARRQPAGLGIAEFDPTVREGSLEWIQVLPEYRGLGIGQALVRELLRRMKGKAAFVTVSGEVDNQTRPEQLYRRCGFTGTDICWLLEK
jgi:ribosomal protein S18 acetylase RimI-like enzyme